MLNYETDVGMTIGGASAQQLIDAGERACADYLRQPGMTVNDEGTALESSLGIARQAAFMIALSAAKDLCPNNGETL